MKRRMYGLVTSMVAALIMTGCGQTPAVQEKGGTGSADAQTSSPQNPKGTIQEPPSSRTDIEPADEITFWSTKKDCFAEFHEEFIREAGIEVNTACIGSYGDIVNKVMAGIAGKKLPDVTQLGRHHEFAQMYDSGYLLPVEDYISKGIVGDVLPGFWKRFTYKDKKVILPFQGSMLMLYCNKTMFDQVGILVPKTMEDVVSAAREVRDMTGSYGSTFYSGYPWYIMASMYNSSTAPIASNKPQMNIEPVKKIFGQVPQMANVDRSIPKSQHSTAQKDFCNGKTGILMTFCANYAKVKKLVNGKFKITLASFPRVNTMDITMDGNGLGLFKTTPEKQKTVTMFVEFVLDNRRVTSNCLTSDYIPVTNGAIDTETYRKHLEDPNRQVVNEQLPYLGGAAVNPADSLVWSEIMSLINSVEVEPDADLGGRLAETDGKIEKYLNEYIGR